MRTPLVLVGFVALFACRPAPIKNPDVSGLPSPRDALDLVLAAGKERRTMRALGRVTYFGDGQRIRLSSVIAVERPGNIRVETLSPLEQPVDVMASDGERLWLLSSGSLREGPATPENIARLIPVPLHAQELVDAMLGGVPHASRYTPSAIDYAGEDRERWKLELTGTATESATLVIDPARKVVESATLKDGGGVSLALSFDDFETVEPSRGLFPWKIGFQIPRRDLDVSIRLKEVEVNVDLSPTLFSLKAPPGTRVEPLDSPPIVLP